MPRSFSETDKENIRLNLIAECKKSWSLHGYKRTNVGELCAKVGISTGAFYAFYESKEALFCEVMDDFQESTRCMFKDTLSSEPTRDEICEALEKLYLEYAKNNIITKRHGPDYRSLLNKLPSEWREKHRANSIENLDNTLFAPSLKLKMSKDKAHGVIDTLLLTVANKDVITDHFEIFRLLLGRVIDEIYEF
ncbi:MAG: TetR/AcrR family transcriptional regulator [Oscillospiraceae bacterium]|jgi:AcrR family transcriptional regulator|nr:TetR/AcrR family transcriptional regulator [Oscillospiraceae bacterium]